MCAVTDLMCSDHLYPRVRRMCDLTTAIFSILYPSPVFLCFITHTSAIKLHTTVSFHCYTKNTTHIPPSRQYALCFLSIYYSYLVLCLNVLYGTRGSAD